MVEKWKLKKSEKLHSYRIFSTRRDISEHPLLGTHEFFVIESADWINIIPITQKGEVVLIKQFRHGIRDITLEIPGGIVEEGEPLLEAAKRELLEETGYESSVWKKLGIVYPNPAIMSNRCHVFLADAAVKVAEPVFDGSEDIETILCPMGELKGLIKKGVITHSIVLSALALYFLSS